MAAALAALAIPPTALPQRGRGRPPGSKNKRRVPLTDRAAALAPMRSVPDVPRLGRQRAPTTGKPGPPIGYTRADRRWKIEQIGNHFRKISDWVLPTVDGVQSLTLATRYLHGGKLRFLEYVQLAAMDDQPDAVKVMAVVALLTAQERIDTSLDDMVMAAGVRPSRLMAAVVATAMEYGKEVGNLIAASLHPQVVAATARAAMTGGPDGVEDREMLLQHAGFLPQKGVPSGGGPVINITATAQAAAAGQPSVPSFLKDAGVVGPARAAAFLPAARVAEPLTFHVESQAADEDEAQDAVFVPVGRDA